MKILVSLFALCWLFSSCKQPEASKNTEEGSPEVTEIGNPAAPGFDLENSDVKALEIADQVMEAMGGRSNWDNTRVVAWNFLGIRSLIWDKWSGDVRIDVPEKELTILLNIHTLEGKVKQAGNEFNEPDSLIKYIERGKAIWINDSYWLVMPFKLKDSGVTLKYLGEENTETGAMTDVLELTFADVGNTPNNRYKICIDKQSHLVCQWEFFRHYEDDSSVFVRPWEEYTRYGDILLSGNRGNRHLTDIQVLDSVPESVFKSFDPVDLTSI